MSDTIKIEVGTTLEEIGKRAVIAWNQAIDGEIVEARETVLSFAEWDTFTATFTTARVAMLRHLAAQGPATSIRSLAEALGRDYRRVHDDVSALLAVGLLRREGTRITLAVMGAEARISFGTAA